MKKTRVCLFLKGLFPNTSAGKVCVLPSTDASQSCLDTFAVWGSNEATSGRHMPSETDVWGVRGHLGPLMQIKEEKWGTTEMNKPLKWLQGWTAPSETLMSITQISVWWRAGCLHPKRPQKPGPKIISTNLHGRVITLMTWAQNWDS